MMKSALVLLIIVLLFGPQPAAAAENAPASLTETERTQEEIEALGWQVQAAFPDWKGYTDNTLAMNSMISFTAYHGQGSVYVRTAEKVESKQQLIP